MKKILFFILFITMLAFSASAQEATTTTITSRNHGFSIDVPADWIIMIPDFDSTTIVVMSNEGLGQEVSIYYDSLYDGGVKMSFDKICETYIKTGNDSSIYKLKSRGKKVINGMDCYWSVSMEVDGSNKSTRYYYNLGNDHFVIVECDAEKEYFEKCEILYKKVFESVKNF